MARVLSQPPTSMGDMLDPSALYEMVFEGDIPDGLPFVAGLTGFTDAGSAISQFSEYAMETFEHRLVAQFDSDILYDYRARRPGMYFEQDHLTAYEPPSLGLYLAYDELHQPFLFLTGFEPDFRWNQFTTAVRALMERFHVSSMTWVHAIPMPVPHTRPIGVTVSGNRSDLIEAMSVWKPHTQVPANVLHLLEYQLQETPQLTAGFVLLIPHYLAETEYPPAAVSTLESISAATGLIFPTDRLREKGREFIAKIDEQVSANPELARLVGTLEERHDAYMEGSHIRSPLTDIYGEVPTADEIAAELEKFLASRRNHDADSDR